MIQVLQITLMYLILMKIKVGLFLSMLMLSIPFQAQARFPEFGFCPLGGPPGWFNRLSGQKYRYHYRTPVHTRATGYVPFYNGVAPATSPVVHGYDGYRVQAGPLNRSPAGWQPPFHINGRYSPRDAFHF